MSARADGSEVEDWYCGRPLTPEKVIQVWISQGVAETRYLRNDDMLLRPNQSVKKHLARSPARHKLIRSQLVLTGVSFPLFSGFLFHRLPSPLENYSSKLFVSDKVTVLHGIFGVERYYLIRQCSFVHRAGIREVGYQSRFKVCKNRGKKSSTLRGTDRT